MPRRSVIVTAASLAIAGLVMGGIAIGNAQINHELQGKIDATVAENLDQLAKGAAGDQ